MKNSIATILSYALHPLLAPAAGVFLLTHSGTYVADLSQELKNLIYLTVVTLTLVLPVCLIPFYLYFKIARNVELSDRNERIVPLVITLMAYLASFLLIHRMPVSQLYERFLIAASISIACVLVVSFFWKISAHMTAMGGLIGLVLALSKKVGTDMMLFLMVFIFLSGLAGYARLKLNAHSPGQIYTGFLLGLLVVFFVILF